MGLKQWPRQTNKGTFRERFFFRSLEISSNLTSLQLSFRKTLLSCWELVVATLFGFHFRSVLLVTRV